MESFDISIFHFVNHDLSNPLLNLLIPLISKFGSGELYFVPGILLLFSRKKEFKTLGILILAGLTVSYYITGFLKILIARPRPFVALPDAILLGTIEKNYSFPSNHSVTAFMMAALLSKDFKKYTLFYSLAGIVAFSRIYIGVHYPSDVIVGAIIGVVIGLFLNRTMYYVRSTNDEKSPRGPIG